ncbi:MAG: methyltransferase domain-containing protein [Methanophagales archaeon]|jgi:ubiquinone/menaquinone biosynthesis C-methylase UbiE|nr:methyltransferase domain-containing protein [Methanophagales archaeon]
MKMNDSESLKLKERFEKVCESRFNVWFLNSIDPLLFGKAVRVMPLKKNSKVIELGCGTGWASRRMAKIAIEGEVVGIDLLESMIETAKQFTAKDKSRNYENLSFMVADAESIPYPDNYFDYAISITSFSWWRNPDRGLEEIERILKPDGQFYAVDVCKERRVDNLMVRPERYADYDYKENLYSRREYRELFEKKFENVYQKNFSIIWALLTVGTKKR